MQKIITKSYKETQDLGENFVKKIHPGDVLCLYGDLGAGKTTFTQGLVRGLGIKKRIISPTFVIVRSYKMLHGMLYHIDLYRIDSKESAQGIGLFDIFDQKNAISVIEWPEKIKNYLPKKRWELHFAYVDENKREIVIEDFK